MATKKSRGLLPSLVHVQARSAQFSFPGLQAQAGGG